MTVISLHSCQRRQSLRIRCPNVIPSLLAVLFAFMLATAPNWASAKQIEFPNGGRADIADDGTITGTCQLVGGRVDSSGYSGTVVLPDGARLPAGCYETYIGKPDHSSYPGPCDGSYAFKATKKDIGYFVYVYSQNAAAPAPGVIISRPPAGYTYQHAYGEHWTPKILTTVSFRKVSADGSFTSMNAEYLVAGATYDIHDAESHQKVATITTGRDGMASCTLSMDTRYYAVETSAPKGYVRNENRVEFTAGDGEVSLSDNPIKVKVTIRKKDSATHGGAQPGTSLAGAVFKLVDARGAAQEATTDDEGSAKFEPIPLGHFSIVETRAPEGYKLDSAVHEYFIGADSAHNDGVVTAIFENDFLEDVMAFDLELAKFKEDPNAEGSGVRWPAEGVQFQIISRTTNKVVTTLTTDVYGFARTPEDAWFGLGKRPASVKGSIPYDRKGYLVREVASSVPEGYERMDDFTIDPNEQVDGLQIKYIIENSTPSTRLQIVKTDRASGQVVPLAGFSFRLLDTSGKPITQEAWYPNHVSMDTFTTDETGAVTLPEQLVPGTYLIEETSVQPPYLLAEKPLKITLSEKRGAMAVVRFANEQAVGSALLIKRDAETGAVLSGAEYDVIAADTISGPDGLIQAVAGEVVGRAVSNEKGQVRIDGLPLGKGTASFAFMETKAPTGYVLDPTPVPVELSYKDGKTALVEARVEATNKPTKFIVEKVEKGSEEPLEGVSFELLSCRDGDKPQTKQTERDGRAQWDRLPAGVYEISELKTLAGYLLDGMPRTFTVTPEGSVQGDGMADGIFKLANDFIKIDVSKRDSETEEELSGAHLTLKDKKGDVIDSWISGNKPHRIERLQPGEYILEEERSPLAHDVSDPVTFTVQPTGDVQRIVMYDTPVAISGRVDKRQEIARPIAPDTVANGDGQNRAEPQHSTDGLFDYSLDWENTSNSWVDEFTVTDALFGCEEGTAELVGITTPVANGDYDGLYNLWYRTDKPLDNEDESCFANATLDDGHENPWLTDGTVSGILGDDGRALDYTGWRLWRKRLSTEESVQLDVGELNIPEGQQIVAVRFEYGRVDANFSTRKDEWNRKELKALHDDAVDATGSHGRNDGSGGSGNPMDPKDPRSPTTQSALLHMRATKDYVANTAIRNYLQLDAYRNGGGVDLEAHDIDEVEQRAGEGPKPIPVRKPTTPMPQTGDSAHIAVALFETIGLTVAGAGYALRKGWRRKVQAKAL